MSGKKHQVADFYLMITCISTFVAFCIIPVFQKFVTAP
jgi:hypothetical protein